MLKHQRLEPGQIVRVRQRNYLVEEFFEPHEKDDSSRAILACVDDDAQGEPLSVLWDHEVDTDILEQDNWEHISRKGFDDPRWFAAYFNTIRWNCATATDPNLFQAPFRAGIKLDAYQLEPLRKALHLPRVNLFIADDVGLGKTIEAGLIVQELLLRRRVRDIVVSCPPSMLDQWKDEMETRFGLPFIIIDREYMMRVRRERGFSINPWDTHTRFLISHRLLIDESYTTTLRSWLGEMRPGSMLILDEAHHAAPSSGQRYAIDSKITRSIREIAPCFEHRLFLSATPHNGHSNSFSALLEILDPQRFIRGITPDKANMKDVIVRRLKDDVRDIVGGFPIRKVIQHVLDNLPQNTPELHLATLLAEYQNLRTERLKGESVKKKATAELVTIGLQKRLLSSVWAFARTLRVHQKTVHKHWEEFQNFSSSKKTLPQSDPVALFALVADSVDPDDDLATIPSEELAQTEEAQFEAATRATFGPVVGDAELIFAHERALLDQMSEIAEEAKYLPDARCNFLIHWIKEHLCPTPHLTQTDWSDQRIIIFTEYDDTRRYLVDQLSREIADEERIAVYHGPSSLEERENLKKAFNAEPKKNKLRILIATDAAREGLNLQAHCWNLFHFDVPWNPSRMEQRNGRIDRKLQPKPEVFCHYFVYAQRPEDRVLETLVKKTERIRKELGSLSQVIDGRLGDLLKKGIQRTQIDSLVDNIETADAELLNRDVIEEELESNRTKIRQDVTKEINALRTQLERSKMHVGFDMEHFQTTISASLELLNAPPLERIGNGSETTMFRFPPLDLHSGAGPSWADTMDSLREQRTEKKQRLHEWRQKAPIRPVIFEDRGRLDESTVQLHLEQRVVRRLLARFIAQGFTQHELSRACLAQTDDAIPRIALLGRLCLYGENAARLHEEIVAITARWIEPEVRKSKLKPYAKDAEKDTLDSLRKAILHPTIKGIPAAVKKNLLQSIPRDVEELLGTLIERCEANAKIAIELLSKRGDQEALLMRGILEKQQKHIRDKRAKDAEKSLFDEIEEIKRQMEAERRAWERRLESLDCELVKEPERIRNMFAVKAQRIEPVGLVYLWPVTG